MGKAALEMVKAQKPDLVILDLMLPGIRGLEVCKFIRRESGNGNTPHHYADRER